MAVYLVSHKKMRKTAKLDLDESLIRNAKFGYRKALVCILMQYKEATGYVKRLRYEDLKIEKIKEESTPNNSSFAHRADDLSACEETCSYCEIGQYEKCLNR